MAAPKGNKFWQIRSRHGRKKLFNSPELLWEAACEYFAWCDENPMNSDEVKSKSALKNKELTEVERETKIRPLARPYTLVGLCLYLGCSSSYFRQMKREYDPDLEEDFLTTLKNIEDAIYNQQFSGAAAGQFNANFIGKAIGLVEKTDHSSKDGSMTPKPTITVRDQKTADNLNKLMGGKK